VKEEYTFRKSFMERNRSFDGHTRRLPKVAATKEREQRGKKKK
jgi:hypothetical protein